VAATVVALDTLDILPTDVAPTTLYASASLVNVSEHNSGPQNIMINSDNKKGGEQGVLIVSVSGVDLTLSSQSADSRPRFTDYNRLHLPLTTNVAN